jgi:hypothetical protein
MVIDDAMTAHSPCSALGKKRKYEARRSFDRGAMGLLLLIPETKNGKARVIPLPSHLLPSHLLRVRSP